VCSAKQSIRKVFAKSERAADIRGVVQGLNMKGGEARAAAAEAAEPSPTNSPHDDRAQVVPKERSAWGAFVSQAPPSDDEAEADDDAGDDGGETTTQWEQSVSAKRQSRKVHPTAAAGPAPQQPRPRSPARPPDSVAARTAPAAGEASSTRGRGWRSRRPTAARPRSVSESRRARRCGPIAGWRAQQASTRRRQRQQRSDRGGAQGDRRLSEPTWLESEQLRNRQSGRRAAATISTATTGSATGKGVGIGGRGGLRRYLRIDSGRDVRRRRCCC
jgi:hypothetical protein